MNASSLRATLVLGVLVLVVLVAAACGRGGSDDVAEETPSGDPPAAGTDAPVAAEPGQGASGATDVEELTGRILITGTAQMEFVTLQIEGGGAVNLSGTLLAELQRLSGAVVSVRGSRTGAAAPLEMFETTEYEVTSIDGQRPTVGILQERDGEFTIAGETTVRLTGDPDAFRPQVGGKVWVVGRQTDAGLQVQSYGIIRER